ncbi:MAG: O-antigen ligase family protein [Patescibacteria group bacterium]|nr:O-antigen ligase family protein [Patescibacteria group bacterium]
MDPATTFAVIAALLFFSLCVLDRKLALAVFCALLPVYLIRFTITLPFGPLDGLPTTLLEIFFVVLFLSWLLFGKEGQKGQKVGLCVWLPGITLLLIGSVVGVLVSPDPIAALGVWRAYFLEPVLFFVMFTDMVRDASTRRMVLGALGISISVIGISAVYQKVTGFGIPNPVWVPEEVRRVTSFFGFPNGVGLIAAPITVLMAGWTVSSTRKDGAFRNLTVFLLGGMAAVLGVLSVLFAVSEGAMLGVAAGLLVFGLLYRPLRKAALIVLIAACALTIFYKPLTDYTSLMLSMRDDSWHVRQIVWQESLDMLYDRPIMGAGLAGYQTALEPYHEAKHIEIFMYPHNFLLNFWSETGIIGLAGFLVIVWTFFMVAIRLYRDRKGEWLPTGVIAAMIALLIHGLVDVPYLKNDISLLFWIIIGLAESMRRQTRDIREVSLRQPYREQSPNNRR